MTFTPASSASLAAFIAIVAGVLAAIVGGAFFAARRAGEVATRFTTQVTITVAAWLIAFTLVIASGIIHARPMPLVPIALLVTLVVSIVFALSPFGRRLATLPLWMLVGFQSFRLPLELVLHAWAHGRTIPQSMTWTGQNLDIISGVLALIAGVVLGMGGHRMSERLRRMIAWTANAVGLVLLSNVIRVAVMSSPLPFAWQVDPPLQLLLYLPYAWIVPVCVGGALAGHIVLTQTLLRPKMNGPGRGMAPRDT